MQALAAGWYIVVDPLTWVHHVRSASFGNRREALAKAGAERMDEMHPNYSGAVAAIAASPAFAEARYRLARQFRSLATGGGRPKPQIMFVITTRVGRVPHANRDLILALSDAFERHALCCDRGAQSEESRAETERVNTCRS